MIIYFVCGSVAFLPFDPLTYEQLAAIIHLCL